MIGFFDSGLGGLAILKEVEKTLPEYSYVYLGDNARTPYGCRSEKIIYEYTCEGVNELFLRGAKIVVLACNTASAVALRKIQQEYLPKYHPDKKVLGIVIPMAEEVGNAYKKIGIFATEATVESNSFKNEIAKINSNVEVVQQACPLLVPMIESGETEFLEEEVKKYIRNIFVSSGDVEAIILGCTHYALIENFFRANVSENVKIISQGKIVAEKLKDYLSRHVDIEYKLDKNKKRIFLTTENSEKVNKLAKMFYGKEINFSTIKI